MNYTTITFNNETIGLKYGMASLRYLTDKFDNNSSFINNELTEIGIAHILYAGYYNNCLVKNIDTKITFEEFVDWIECNLKNDIVIEDIKKAIDVWSQNEYIKQSQDADNDSKKKKFRGKK